VGIVTPPFAEAAAVARSLGGAAKPSGAGGGDVGVALFTTTDAVAEFGRRCPPGVSVLDVKIDPDGARRRQPETVELT
jgi:phosphomevalonate kinase